VLDQEFLAMSETKSNLPTCDSISAGQIFDSFRMYLSGGSALRVTELPKPKSGELLVGRSLFEFWSPQPLEAGDDHHDLVFPPTPA
jgi:hypothetical protein